MATLLILGGTSEAAALAAALAAQTGLHVITSLAGRTRTPRPLPGEVRTGGFGGIEGLERYLRDRPVDALIDATHPFAARMGGHAAQACSRVQIPRLRLLRPPWARRIDDRWLDVDDAKAAAAALPKSERRVFLTSGHRDLDAFAGLDGLWFLLRTVEPLSGPRPANLEWLQARGPFFEEDELALLRSHRIDVLVTKASGGAATYPKIAAARRLGLPVIMIRRPPPPPGPIVDTVDAAIAWLDRH